MSYENPGHQRLRRSQPLRPFSGNPSPGRHRRSRGMAFGQPGAGVYRRPGRSVAGSGEPRMLIRRARRLPQAFAGRRGHLDGPHLGTRRNRDAEHGGFRRIFWQDPEHRPGRPLQHGLPVQAERSRAGGCAHIPATASQPAARRPQGPVAGRNRGGISISRRSGKISSASPREKSLAPVLHPW